MLSCGRPQAGHAGIHRKISGRAGTLAKGSRGTGPPRNTLVGTTAPGHEAFFSYSISSDSSDYNFRYEPKRSLSQYAFNKLVEEKGAHEAARIFNKVSGRHFSRS